MAGDFGLHMLCRHRLIPHPRPLVCWGRRLGMAFPNPLVWGAPGQAGDTPPMLSPVSCSGRGGTRRGGSLVLLRLPLPKPGDASFSSCTLFCHGAFSFHGKGPSSSTWKLQSCVLSLPGRATWLLGTFSLPNVTRFYIFFRLARS